MRMIDLNKADSWRSNQLTTRTLIGAFGRCSTDVNRSKGAKMLMHKSRVESFWATALVPSTLRRVVVPRHKSSTKLAGTTECQMSIERSCELLPMYLQMVGRRIDTPIPLPRHLQALAKPWHTAEIAWLHSRGSRSSEEPCFLARLIRLKMCCVILSS
jgi:hypothetical protein